MTARFLRRSLLTLPLLAACFSDGRDDDDDDHEHDQLTDLEWSMVGTWVGELPGGRVHYYVFDADRTGCRWEHEGDGSTRIDNVRVRDWRLHPEELDDALHMPLRWLAPGGDTREDAYDAAADRIHPADAVDLDMAWVDVRIDCNSSGSTAIETEVERLGSKGNGQTGGGNPTGGNPTDTGTTPPDTGTTPPDTGTTATDTGGTLPTGPTTPIDTATTTGPTDPTDPTIGFTADTGITTGTVPPGTDTGASSGTVMGPDTATVDTGTNAGTGGPAPEN